MNGILAFVFMVTGIVEATTINVSSYGAFPNDGVDDTVAINNAIAAAGSNSIIVFADGVYDLETEYDVQRFLKISSKTDVTLQGAVLTDGAPATTLLRHVALENMASPPRTAYIYNCSGLTLENFVIDNTPHLCTAGEIVDVDPNGTYVTVEIFEGLPVESNTACYSANVWDPDTLDLKEVESLTYTVSPANWSVLNAANRTLKLESVSGLNFLDKIEVGEYMSWHYGWNGRSQLEVAKSSDVVLENLHFSNVINMGILCGGTDGLTLRDITMRPLGEQLAVGPRDGIHLSRSSGSIEASGLDITGVRWDGFVVHAPYATITNTTSSTQLTIAVLMNTSGQTISSGSTLGFIDSLGEVFERTVSSATFTQTVDGKSEYSIVLSSALPSFAAIGTHLKVRALAPPRVSLTDSNFENIAGSALILLTDNITVSNTTHRKIMYSAAHIGSNTGTGMAGDNIQILNSEFDACGWVAKGDNPGVITLDNLHFVVTNGILQDIVIRGNLFKNQLFNLDDPAVNVADVDSITIQDNLFENVCRGMIFDVTTTSGYHISDNTIVIDNDENSLTYTEVSGSFSDSSLKGYDGSKTRYSSSTDAMVEWEFIAPKSGSYDAYIYVVAHTTSDTNATISVESDGATTVETIDFTTGGGWHHLGTYTYTGQRAYTVSNQRQGGYLRADAVKFVQ